MYRNSLKFVHHHKPLQSTKILAPPLLKILLLLTTLSPIFTFVTSEPIASTKPAMGEPRIVGYWNFNAAAFVIFASAG
jgi:hypothetical protein